MKKLLLILFLSLGFTSSTYADAICNDGWISKSSGSGTCSWHGGVYKWLDEKKNKKKTSDKYIEEIYDVDYSGVIGKCKGTYKQKEICRNRVRIILQKDEDWLKQRLEYEYDERSIEQRLDDLLNGKPSKDYRSEAEKELDELLKNINPIYE